MTTPQPPQPQDTGDIAEVPEDQRLDTDDYEHPDNQNEPVDLSDVEDAGEVVDVQEPAAPTNEGTEEETQG